MTHYLKTNDKAIDVSFICTHSGITSNTCPTGYGACESCPHCQVSLTAADFLALWKDYQEKTGAIKPRSFTSPT